MNDLRPWFPLIIQVVSMLVAGVWFFAKLDKRIELNKQEMNLKLGELTKEIKEIKNNYFRQIDQLVIDIKDIGTRLTEHLINSRGSS